MVSRFQVDKAELMERVLDRYAARANRNRTGWQKVSCINETAHTHGDRNPSASVNLTIGKYHCFACGLAGDGFDLLLELEQVKADKALQALDLKPGERDNGWLF